jgi:hypothetical protein
MKECRVCESCGHQNDVSYLVCEIENCGGDLTIVDITIVPDEPTPDLPEEDPAGISGEISTEAPSEEPTLSKDCGRRTMPIPQIKLVSRIDQYEIKIPLIGCVLGREGDVSPEYFEGKSIRVSRQHLKIYTRGDAYYVVDEISTNKTYINKQELQKNKDYMLRVGDSLRMADMDFLVVED